MNTERFYVYTYSYPNGVPFYVGIGTGKRINTHLYRARNNSKDYNEYKKRIIQKILRGGEAPRVSKLIDGIDREFAALIEQEYIAKHGRRSEGGLLVNMTAGGDGVCELSAEAEGRRRKSLAAASSSTRFKKGFTPRNKGVPMTAEVREKCRQANLGNRYALGVKHTAEARANMSAAHIGKPSGMRGKKHSAETIEKMRAVKLGKPSGRVGQKASAVTTMSMKAAVERDKWVCPHCNVIGNGRGAANRWHFDNCKKKVG